MSRSKRTSVRSRSAHSCCRGSILHPDRLCDGTGSTVVGTGRLDRLPNLWVLLNSARFEYMFDSFVSNHFFLKWRRNGSVVDKANLAHLVFLSQVCEVELQWSCHTWNVDVGKRLKTLWILFYEPTVIWTEVLLRRPPNADLRCWWLRLVVKRKVVSDQQ